MSSFVGSRIKQLRKQAKLTQKEVADKLGFSERHYMRFETGKQIPKDDMLERIIDVLGRGDVRELQELRDQDTQGAIVAPNTTETAEATPTLGSELSDITTESEAPTQSEPEREGWQASIKAAFQKRAVYYIGIPVCLVVAIVFVLTSSLWAQSNTVKPVTITGTVLCMNHEPVVDVWYDVFKGNTIDKKISGHANLGSSTHNGSQMAFGFTLMGDAYNLHVGCGGSPQGWKGTYKTESGSGPVHDHKAHFFICYNVSAEINYGPCDLKY